MRETKNSIRLVCECSVGNVEVCSTALPFMRNAIRRVSSHRYFSKSQASAIPADLLTFSVRGSNIRFYSVK